MFWTGFFIGFLVAGLVHFKITFNHKRCRKRQ
jgi:uncharacterized membrane protein YciS (DUF1049 family)